MHAYTTKLLWIGNTSVEQLIYPIQSYQVRCNDSRHDGERNGS